MIRTIAPAWASARHRWLRSAMLMVAAAALVAGCGSSGGRIGLYGQAPSGKPAAHSAAAGHAAVALRHTSLGTILTTGRGFTMYVFEADRGTTSACTGACAAAWPPVTTGGSSVAIAAGAARSLIGVTTRPGGLRQLTYAGHPLYTFAGDTAPGATSGQGSLEFGARWDVITPTGREVISGLAP